MTRISWIACWDPADGTDRMTAWVGETSEIVITGLPPGFAANVPSWFDLPPGAQIHGVSPRDRDWRRISTDTDSGRRLAADLGGVLFTVYRRDAIELLLDVMATPRTFVTVPGKSARFLGDPDLERRTEQHLVAAVKAGRARALEEPETGLIHPPPEPAQPTQTATGVYRIRADWYERDEIAAPTMDMVLARHNAPAPDLAGFVRDATVEQLSPADPFDPNPPAPSTGDTSPREAELEREVQELRRALAESPAAAALLRAAPGALRFRDAEYDALRRALADAIPVIEAAVDLVGGMIWTDGMTWADARASRMQRRARLVDAVVTFGGGGPEGIERASGHLAGLRVLVGVNGEPDAPPR